MHPALAPPYMEILLCTLEMKVIILGMGMWVHINLFALDAKKVTEVLKNGSNTSLSLSDCTHISTDIPNDGEPFLYFPPLGRYVDVTASALHKITSAAIEKLITIWIATHSI